MRQNIYGSLTICIVVLHVGKFFKKKIIIIVIIGLLLFGFMNVYFFSVDRIISGLNLNKFFYLNFTRN